MRETNWAWVDARLTVSNLTCCLRESRVVIRLIIRCLLFMLYLLWATQGTGFPLRTNEDYGGDRKSVV